MDEDSFEEECYIESIKQLKKDLKQNFGSTSYKKLVVDLADGGLGSSDLETLLAGLDKVRGISSCEFYLFNCKLTDESLNNILEMLLSRNKDSLEEMKMELTENSLGAAAFISLLEASNSMPKLKKLYLDLSGNSLSKGSFTSSPLRLSLNNLKFFRLSLEDTFLPGNVIEKLISELKNLPQLVTLVLNIGSCSFGFKKDSVQDLLSGHYSNLDFSFTKAAYTQIKEMIFSSILFCTKFKKLKLDFSNTSMVVEQDIIDWINSDVQNNVSISKGNKMDVEESTQSASKFEKSLDLEIDQDLQEEEDDLEAIMMKDPEYRELVAEFKQKTGEKKLQSEKTIILKDSLASKEAFAAIRKLSEISNCSVLV